MSSRDVHDRGILELAKGALGSSEKVLQILVNTANTPEVMRGIRNAMILAKIADSIDPEVATTISAKEATKSRSYK